MRWISSLSDLDARATRAAVSLRRRADAARAVRTLAVTALCTAPLVAARTVAADPLPAVRATLAGQPLARQAEPAPDPRLTADSVVGIVLDALRRNDEPTRDRGIAVTFTFASPTNRAAVGTLDRFGDLVRDDTYRPLLNHRHAVRGPVKLDGERASVRVVVYSATGEGAVYTFTLSRQPEGAYKGCWMTDGVTREPPSPLAAPNIAANGRRAAPRGARVG